ncbi:MAG: transcriptional repressor [Muribaculaceae bacterium]|nr:transcriptional repressor [Muribaculaceae bacterium]
MIQEEKILEDAGVRVTANRMLVLRALLAAHAPVSLIELETELQTLERSSISRTLTLFADHDLVHLLEDGRGITKYELCHSHDHHELNDEHPHFYCEKCHRVFCLDSEVIPQVSVPDGFDVHSVNFMLKGLCRDCRQ